MCSPSATSASEPNSVPPTISAIIIAVHKPMTIHVFRSLRACAAPRNAWLCAPPAAAPSNSFMFASGYLK